MERITFYDSDSNLITKDLTAEGKRWYLKEIKKHITYFKRTYRRADFQVDISDLGPGDAARRVRREIEAFATSGSQRVIDAAQVK